MLAVEDAVSTTTFAKHLQCIHSSDSIVAVSSPFCVSDLPGAASHHEITTQVSSLRKHDNI
jgi:hypothetical protein